MVTRALQSLICVCVLAVASGRASAQVQISPNITFEVRTGTNAAPSGDPLLNLMLSQPPIDTSELFVHAEFDPPTVAMGQRTTLRVIVTALQDSVAFPDPLPAPVSLSVTRGGSAQQFQAMTGRMQVRSTFNFTVRPNASGSVGLPAFDITVAGRSVRVPGAKLNVLPSREPVPAVELLFDKMESI